MSIIIYESTPNPQAMKFIVTDREIAQESANFPSAKEAGRSPLALKLFGFPWASGVFIGTNFVTVTKQDWVDWTVLADPLANLIEEHIVRGEPVLKPLDSSKATSSDTMFSSDPIVAKIQQFIEYEVRPAVAMDGGDVAFVKFESGIVYLNLKGACSGCPSAALTLKEGIESRLKAAVPAVQSVVESML
jgi:Fe-S cluster biogenesis protein NfuA